MRYLILIFLLLSCFLFVSSKAFAFAENTTKGYANCMACHISPNGGGILTDYGRSLSSELMSTWKLFKGFERPFYGAAKNTQHLKLGGQYRTIQVYAENDQIKVKKQFQMQNNIELAAQYSKAFIVGTIGKQGGPEETPTKDEIISERHYVLWEASPEIRLRAGKFRQHFGINHPNHTRFTKSGLGFGSNSETYNLEVSKYFEWGEINTSTSLGDFVSGTKVDENKRNVVFNFTHYLGGKYRIGANTLLGRSKTYKRQVLGVNAIFPIFQNFIGRSEVNVERKSLTSNNESGEPLNAIYGDHQYGYKLFKGINGYLVFEHAQSNIHDHETLITSSGLGLQLLPFAHIEIQAEFQKRTYQVDPKNKESRGFLNLHLYH